MRSAMVGRTGISISRHYVVSINAMPSHIYTLHSKKLKGRTESYCIPDIYFLNSTTIRHGVLILGYYVEFILTAVSSN